MASAATAAAVATKAGEPACEQKHACIGWQDSVAATAAVTAAATAKAAREAACEQQHAWGGRIRWRRQRQREQRQRQLVSNSMHGMAQDSVASAATAAAIAAEVAGAACEQQHASGGRIRWRRHRRR